MRFPSLPLALIVVSPFPAQLLAATTPFDLVNSFFPNTTGVETSNSTEVSGGSNIFGQTVDLPPFTLGVITNETHALVTFNISQPVAKIGWVAIGFGTSMLQSGLVILWPANTAGSQWIISPRSINGYTQPRPASLVNTKDPYFTVQQNLFSTFTSGKQTYTTISFLRPLAIPSAQTLFPLVAAKQLNLTRTAYQNMVFAYSSTRPESTAIDATISQHDAGQYGPITVDLSSSFINSATGGAKEATMVWSRYNKIVVAHAALAMITWLLVAPTAVLIARLGRGWGKWFTWHSSIQGYFTFPATCLIVALGMGATHEGGSSGVDAHTIIGFIIIVVSIILVGLGYWSHKILPNRTGNTRSAFAVTHIVGGFVTLVLAFAQIGLGFSEWKGRPGREATNIIYAIFVVAFLLIYGTAVTFLVVSRRRDGRSWRYSFFGLGSDQATKPWVHMMNWSSTSAARPDASNDNIGMETELGQGDDDSKFVNIKVPENEHSPWSEWR